LPDNVHQLPLAFVTGLKALLGGPFIDRDARFIRARAALGGGSSRQDEPAGLVALVRLAAALDAWIVELKDVGDAGLDATTRRKLEEAPARLKPALQLAVQTLLNHHVSPPGGGRYGLALTERGGEPAPLARYAESLATLFPIEKRSVESPFLKSRLVGLTHYFVAHVLAPRLQSPRGALSAEDVIWSLKALESYREHAGDADAPWLASALRRLTELASLLESEAA
jgi:hypothetical protein